MKPRPRRAQPRRQPGTDGITRQRGMTLVELVISIVIIGIAAAALFSAMAAIGGRSADPLLRQQSLSIAEAYLEEILLQPYFDPSALNEPSASVDSSSAVCPRPLVSRAGYDNVCDYAGLHDTSARDAQGVTIGALENYQVKVRVLQLATCTPEDCELEASELEELKTVNALRVDVTVIDPAGQSLLLSGFRACYGEGEGACGRL
jgi:MSHA pilin protein MshD